MHNSNVVKIAGEKAPGHPGRGLQKRAKALASPPHKHSLPQFFVVGDEMDINPEIRDLLEAL